MRVLFLCTGNSCRSQMAEGFVRQFGASTVSAESAGIEAHGLNPRAVDVMREIGIDISRQKSTVMDDSMVAEADVIVTVCDHARELCPAIPGNKRQIHWSFDDPAIARGTESEIGGTFRRVRDEIEGKVKDLISELNGT